MREIQGSTGAKFNKRSTVNNPLGDLRHVLIDENSSGLNISEIYFSEVNPKSIKTWKFHRKQTQNISVAYGNNRIICAKVIGENLLFEIFEIDTKSHHGVLTIPPEIYYTFINFSDTITVLFNGTDTVHDPSKKYSEDSNSKSLMNLINIYGLQ